MKKLYLLLAVIGFILPYYFFISFLMTNGLNIQLLIDQLFANKISTFFAADLIITAIAFLVFIVWESRKDRIKNGWGYVLATLAIGPSFAVPLYLYFRESA